MFCMRNIFLESKQGKLSFVIKLSVRGDHGITSFFISFFTFTADRLAQLIEHRTTVREVVGSNPGRTNT